MNCRRFVIFVACLSPCPPCIRGESPSLESLLAPLAKGHQGTVAIAVKNLSSGESYALNADEPLPTASLIKFPIMVETYYRFNEGKNRPDDMIVLAQEDKVGGSGIL